MITNYNISFEIIDFLNIYKNSTNKKEKWQTKKHIYALSLPGIRKQLSKIDFDELLEQKENLYTYFDIFRDIISPKFSFRKFNKKLNRNSSYNFRKTYKLKRLFRLLTNESSSYFIIDNFIRNLDSYNLNYFEVITKVNLEIFKEIRKIDKKERVK